MHLDKLTEWPILSFDICTQFIFNSLNVIFTDIAYVYSLHQDHLDSYNILELIERQK